MSGFTREIDTERLGMCGLKVKECMRSWKIKKSAVINSGLPFCVINGI